MYSRWFKGVFCHLPGVGCDQFLNKNLDQFFLSHCHADHMEGIEQLFNELMRSNSVKVNHRIFCSSITKSFLVKKFHLIPKKQRFICDLPHNEPRTIVVFDQAKSSMYKIRVTLIPANHCPGSVMFLFESLKDDGELNKRILYTGDFRFEGLSLDTLSALHDDNGQVLPIDELFLDTTFCSKSYLNFPSREESLQAIWNLVIGWVKKNGKYRAQRPKHVVLFHLPAQYGSEAILRDIYERSGHRWKIHADPKKYESYMCSEDLGGCMDSDPVKAEWIHACSWKGDSANRFSNRIPCQEGVFEVCRIRPSAMFFSQDRLPKTAGDPPVKCEGGNVYRVCYSCHSSLTELRLFVKYFQPKKIIPCDMPKDMSCDEVCRLLNSALDIPALASSDSQGQSSFLEFSPMSIVASSDDENDSTKHPNNKGRKRKSLSPIQYPNKRQSTGPLSMESSDEELDEGTRLAKTKRLVFQRSRTDKGANSMPPDTFAKKVVGDKGNRRASLPHNLKIPVITITPSSPSPDINDPDYPEFFQDKPYLESKNWFMSTSVDSAAGDDLKMVTDGTSSAGGSLESTKEIVSSGFSVSAPSCQTDFFLPIDSKSLVSTVSLSDTEDFDMLNSTPEFDEILASAKSERELLNCLKFAEHENKIQ